MRNDLGGRKKITVNGNNYIPLGLVKELDDVTLKLALYSKSGLVFDVTGQTLSLRCKKDNKQTEELSNTDTDTPIVINKSEVDIKLRNSMLSIPGTVKFELNILDSTGAMTTASFFILVTAAELDDDSVVSSNQYSILQQLINNYHALETVDVNAEIVAARDGYSTIGERLNSHTELLEEKAYKSFLSPELFGAKGNGIDDDTDAINSCLAFSGSIPCTVNFTKNYLISDRINVKSNTVINLNNSKLFFDNESNIINNTDLVSNSHWHGIINCEGEITDIKTKILSVEDSASSNISALKTKFTVESSASFTLGDYIAIDIDRVGNQTKDTYRPSCNIMARIVGIGDGYIITDYYTPFNFSEIDFTTNSYYITKVNPCQNVIINGFNAKNISTYSDDKKLLAAGIGIIYGANITINGAKGQNISNPLVVTYYAHNININDVFNYKPDHVGDGQGYCVKLCRTYIANVKNLYGDSCRHLIDLSGSARVEVDFARGVNTTNGDFDLHGMCEHDVTFKNCFGQFYYGNGFDYFPSIMANVVLESCTGKTSFNNVLNIKVDKCDLQYDNQGDNNTVLNAEIYNSTIHFIRQGDSRFMGATRGGKVKPTILFENTKFDSPNTGIGCYPKFMEFYKVEIRNPDINFSNVKGIIKIIDTDNFIIKGGEAKGTIFQPVRTVEGDTDFVINDVYWRVESTDSIAGDTTLRDVFGFNTFAAGVGSLNLLIKSSDFLVKTTNNNSPFMYIEVPVKIDCTKINVTLRNDKFDSKTQYCGKIQLRENDKFILDNFGSEFTKNIANLKHIWNIKGNSMTLYDGEIISIGKEIRILSENGLGIGIVSDGTNIKFKKYVNGVYDSDIATY